MAERKEQLRNLLGATEAEIEQLVCNGQGILNRRDIVGAYGPKLALLQERLGISKTAVGRLFLKKNRLLGSSLETMENRLDWLQARLDLNKAQLLKILGRRADVLTLSTEDNVEPSLDNIQSVLELSDKELTKMIVKQPDLLLNNFSSIDKLAARLSFLQDSLRIEGGDITKLRKVILRGPEILHWPEESMLETKQWLENRFAFENSKCAQMCTIFPSLLASKIGTLDERANDIQKELALDDEELKKMISDYPFLLGKSVKDNMRPKVDYFRVTFSLDAEGVKGLLLRYSNLFGCSMEKNLEPKVQFYSNLAGEVVAKEAILNNPNLLLVSMKRRLAPRLADVAVQDGKIKWTRTLLSRLATRTDAQWIAYGLGDAPRGGGRSRKKT